jgi:hypothetical protein
MRTIRAFGELCSKGVWACGLAATLGLAGCVAPVESNDESSAAAGGGGVEVERSALVVGSGSCNVNIEPLRSIEIVHPLVVNDARSSNATDGPWSFRRLIENMAPSSGASGTDPFLRGIFESWLTNQFINGEEVFARPNVDPLILSNNAFSNPNGGSRTFNLANAPFQLIGVASRLDLRSTTSAGEGRFIFALLTAPPNPTPTSMTVIVEFALPLKAPLDTPLKWANKWHELDALDPVAQTAAFNAKLQEITDVFTARNAMPSRPNGSAVNQFRTNEIALNAPWQLREFRINSAGAMLPAPTATSPAHDSVNQSQAMRDFITQNPVLNATTDTSFFNLKMPDVFGTSFFNGGQANQSFSPGNTGDFGTWSLSATENQDTSVPVDNFGLLTCNGCHTDNKTRADQPFYQVSPFNPGADGTGRLSQFMTQGDSSKGGRRPAEFVRRATDMGNLLCTPAAVDLVVTNVTMSPANPAPGQAVSFSATISNFGANTKPAGAINGVGFFVDGTKVNWSDSNTGALAPGQSLTLTANSGAGGVATWAATAGAHTLQAFVDDVNRIAEGDETNNKLSAPFSVGIDLTVTNISWSGGSFNPTRNDLLTFSATIKNIGSVATPGGTTIGVNFQIDGTGVNWSDSSNTSLAPGASRTLTANAGPGGISTWTAVGGRHRLAAWADDVNRLTDTNRGNNKIDTLLVVQP